MISTCKTVKILLDDSDNSYEIDITVANMSSYIQNMVKDLCNNGETELVMTLLTTQKSIEKLIEYMTYYSQNPIPELYKYVDGKTDWDKQLSDWDKKFVHFDDHFEFFDFFHLVNVMGVPSLMSLVSITCAKQISGMSVEEMRTYFNVKNDFTPEEEEELRKEFSWARDDDETEATVTETTVTETA